ncbi:hypothetical protein [Sanguibacter gelidistatuariae]|uniref:hypothetical protein n=1 Tax=Sanguibacter gelidistatuariae TaxID=1814289 RepID=UPI000B870B59|nr:hypothetical protein [Sanguibacter gelidistatuariae]
MGTTQPVAATLEAQQAATDVEVSGSIPIPFSDVAVVPPDYGFVRFADSGTVKMLLLLGE